MENGESINLHKNKVHRVLAHSYLFYFMFLLIGLFFDFIFPIKIFSNSILSLLGVVFLVVGTFLILWAQKVSRNLKKENISRMTFCQGPYCFTKNPTLLGLLVLTLGFGIVVNALFIVIFSLISFCLTKAIFIKKEEEILTQKYGSAYLEYKKSVKF
jgi:protein-S-isoprenylcysteine O-methyltransferase Ste14